MDSDIDLSKLFFTGFFSNFDILIFQVAGLRASDVVLVGGKFTSPVLPGSVLRINVWKKSETMYIFHVMNRDTGAVVLSDGELGYAHLFCQSHNDLFLLLVGVTASVVFWWKIKTTVSSIISKKSCFNFKIKIIISPALYNCTFDISNVVVSVSVSAGRLVSRY